MSADTPLAPGLDVRAYNHIMGESSITLFATADRCNRLRRQFPESLNGCFLWRVYSARIRVPRRSQ